MVVFWGFWVLMVVFWGLLGSDGGFLEVVGF